MATPNINQNILKLLESRLSQMTEQNILDLNKSHHSDLNNVVTGICKECFETVVWDDTKKDVEFFHIYVTLTNDRKLEGWILKQNLNLKYRNELTNYFVSFITKEYKLDDPAGVFNVYQHQARSLFERLGYFTIDNKDVEQLKGRRFDMMLPAGYKGVVFVPFAVTKKPQIETSQKNTSKQKVDTVQTNFVYVMHNTKNGYYKIGKSITPEYREKTLQAEEPDIVLLEKWEAASHIEITLQRKFKHKRKRGEWFNLTDDDLIEIRKFMEQLPRRRKP